VAHGVKRHALKASALALTAPHGRRELFALDDAAMGNEAPSSRRLR
jgi:hypothetical protein